MVDKLVKKANASLLVGTSSWKEQFSEAITVQPGKWLWFWLLTKADYFSLIIVVILEGMDVICDKGLQFDFISCLIL